MSAQQIARALLYLHITLLELVEEMGGVLDRRWTGEDNWNPHVTHTEQTMLQVGDTVCVDDVDLIAGDASGRRTLIETVRLRKPTERR